MTPQTLASITPIRLLQGFALGLSLLVGGCGGSEIVGPDPQLEPLVGDWEATELRLTNAANTAISVELIEAGASFDLNIQPSGQYTAILVFSLQSQTEIGQVEVNGSRVTLTPDTPPGQGPTAGTFAMQGADRFILDGATEFDFNSDGTPEPAEVHFQFVRK